MKNIIIMIAVACACVAIAIIIAVMLEGWTHVVVGSVVSAIIAFGNFVWGFILGYGDGRKTIITDMGADDREELNTTLTPHNLRIVRIDEDERDRKTIARNAYNLGWADRGR